MTLWRTRKTFGTEMGLSCAFRQWRAKSHCSKLHGYALGFVITLEANTLNEQNWVYDFGNFGWLKEFLKNHFDHKTVIAKDDPLLDQFQKMERFQAVDLVILDDVETEDAAGAPLLGEADRAHRRARHPASRAFRPRRRGGHLDRAGLGDRGGLRRCRARLGDRGGLLRRRAGQRRARARPPWPRP